MLHDTESHADTPIRYYIGVVVVGPCYAAVFAGDLVTGISLLFNRSMTPAWGRMLLEQASLASLLNKN